MPSLLEPLGLRPTSSAPGSSLRSDQEKPALGAGFRCSLRTLVRSDHPGYTGSVMASEELVVHGAREHNLKDVTVRLPRNKLICFTGLSGSGKSSFAFDTIYAEGQ